MRQQLQRVEYSERIAEYTHCCSATLSFEYCCQNSHAKMTARPALFLWFRIVLFLFRCILSVFSTLPALHGVSLAYWWLTLKDRVPCSACHCPSAQEYQWPAAQRDQFLRARSTVYLTSASLIIVSKHKPINSCRHLHPATTTTLASYLKPLVFSSESGRIDYGEEHGSHRKQHWWFRAWSRCNEGSFVLNSRIELDGFKWSQWGN